MFNKLRSIFNRDKKSNDNLVAETVVTKSEDNDNNIINKLFGSETFYYLEIKNEQGNIVKYTQLIGDNKSNMELLCLIFTDKEKVIKYIQEDLSELKKYDIKPVCMNINSIIDFSYNLQNSKIEGVIIDYPYDWAILRFKDSI